MAPQSQLLWTEKYFPASSEEFVGNSEILKAALEWAGNWEKGKPQKPLLLFGQTGAGKTCLAYIIAKMNGWQLFEMNASDLRSKDAIERLAGNAAMNSSFAGNLRLVLIDEVDGLQSSDRGGAGAVSAVIKEARNPIILTANDFYSEKKLLALRSSCTCLEFKKINYLSIGKRLREILSAEGIEFEPEAVQELARNSGGDLRSSLLDLQTLSLEGKITAESVKELGFRERQENVFKVVRQILLASTVEEARNARLSSEADNDLLERWIEENIPRQYSSAEDVANAFDALSRSNIFKGRIMRRQAWELLRYSSELMTSGVALSRKDTSRDFVMYKFPGILSKLSRSSSLRAFKKELGKKIGKRIHSSSHEFISQDLPYLLESFSKKDFAVGFSAEFELDAEEIAFLAGKKEDSKAVREILAESEKFRAEHAKEKRAAGLHSTKGAFSGYESADSESAGPETEGVGESNACREGQTKLF
ncbi:MAG: replication factor C large subunit [archaeon]